jgi:hypothetical protein
LGRPAPEDEKVKDKKAVWFALPAMVPGIGKYSDYYMNDIISFKFVNDVFFEIAGSLHVHGIRIRI